MLRSMIALSFILACGFLLINLSCALWNNWLPLLVVVCFLLAPVPNFVSTKVANASDYMDSSAPGAAVDFGHFLTGFLLTTGLALPIMMTHVGLIATGAGVMSICGGLLVYGSIIAYGRFFGSENDEGY